MSKIIRGLSDDRLVVLFNRVLLRIERAFEGGRQYGIDLPTLHAVCPAYARVYQAIRAEGSRRARATVV